MISIHALREEGDVIMCAAQLGKTISIHALREEGDLWFQQLHKPGDQFLSTPSARRATPAYCSRSRRHSISIHALREEGDRWQLRRGLPQLISIHALREEGDP